MLRGKRSKARLAERRRKRMMEDIDFASYALPADHQAAFRMSNILNTIMTETLSTEEIT